MKEATQKKEIIKCCMTCQNLSCNVETKEKIGVDENGDPMGAYCIGYINNKQTKK